MNRIKLITLALVTLITGSVYGQDKHNFKRVLIGVSFSHDYCSSTVNIAGYIGKRGKPGYTTGLNVCYNFNRSIGLETGIQYSNKGYQNVMKGLVFGSMINPVSGPSGNSGTFRHIYNFHYLDIPLKVNFTFGQRKVRFFTSAGVTTNILMKVTETTSLEIPGEKTDKETKTSANNYNKLNLSPTISAGIDIKFNYRMHLRIEPTLRYGVLKIIDSAVTGYLWSAGLNIGFYFGL